MSSLYPFLQNFMTSLTTLSATGPVGLIALSLGLLSALGASWYFIRTYAHGNVTRDQDAAESDAGLTGQSLITQVQLNRQAIQDLKKNFGLKPLPETTINVQPMQIVKTNVRQMNDIELDIFNTWDQATVPPEHIAECARIASFILLNRERYEAVQKELKIPFYVIGAIHMLEANCDFTRHFSNGDPLNNRTVNVPVGRPPPPLMPPFSWEQTVVDTFRFRNYDQFLNWDLVSALYFCERYNGFGYRRNGYGKSPYVWSYTTAYQKGKYGSDGKYDPNLVSKQAGAAAIFMSLKSMRIDLNEVEPLQVTKA